MYKNNISHILSFIYCSNGYLSDADKFFANNEVERYFSGTQLASERDETNLKQLLGSFDDKLNQFIHLHHAPFKIKLPSSNSRRNSQKMRQPKDIAPEHDWLEN